MELIFIFLRIFAQVLPKLKYELLLSLVAEDICANGRWLTQDEGVLSGRHFFVIILIRVLTFCALPSNRKGITSLAPICYVPALNIVTNVLLLFVLFRFDVLVNGGGAVTLQFQRSPFRPLTRTVFVPWNQVRIAISACGFCDQ